MEKETIAPLVKNAINIHTQSEGCCGGAPKNNADACCVLDEEKKAEGEAGCGCNTTDEKKSKTSCC